MKRNWRKRFLWSSIVIVAVAVPILSIVGPRSALAGIIQAIIPAAVPTANKQGNGSLFQLSSGAVTNGHCGSFDGNGNIVDSGVACSSSGAGTPGSTFFSSTTQAGPSNTATQTSLIGSVSGSTTIAANTFTNGAYMLVEAQGFYSLPAVADSLTLRLKCGSTVLGSASATLSAGVLTNGTWRMWLGVTAIGTGASGAFNTNGVAEFTGSALTPSELKFLNTSNVSYDFTTTCAMDVTAQWGGAQSGESITGTGVVAYVPGAPVTSVNGQTGAVQATATGAIASLPGAGSTGRVYFPTDSLYEILRDNGSGWDYFYRGQKVTPPNNASFATNNACTSMVTAQTNGVITIACPSNGGSDSLRSYEISAPSTPWTRTFRFNSYFPTDNGDGTSAGLILRESGTGKIMTYWFLQSAGGKLSVAEWTNTTTFSSTVNSFDPNASNNGSWCFQLSDAGGVAGNLTFAFSADNCVSTITQATVARNAFFTTGPDKVGIVVNPKTRAASLTLIGLQ